MTFMQQPRPGPEVVVATASQRDGIASALADAFFDDPVMSFILQDVASRTRRLDRLFATLLRGHYLPLGTVWTTPAMEGAALWAPPGRGIIPTSRVLRNGLSMLQALGSRAYVALRALTHVEQLHPKEPHWYLGVLGTRTAQQGKGIGSALLQPALERCDADAIPAYLESSKHSNIAFYRRHGFEVTGEIQLPLGGPTVWPMWREPR
jgi:GNAT superfamily N-acetyltransferase